MNSRSLPLLGILLVVGAPVAEAQTRTVVGRVFDAVTKEAISNGEVIAEDTDARDRIRPDGVFVLHVAPGELELLIRSTGYRQKTVSLSADQETVLVELEPDVLELEQLLITGHGTQRRQHLATSQSHIGGDDLDNVPAATLEQALEGKVAGADIRQNSSTPGGDIHVQLRGITTILGSATPLYIIDGVVISSQSIESGAAAITGGQMPASSRVADLNPYDVQSVELLKGAAATALYGSRGSNGVVIIRTKRGRSDRWP
ncbi:MAG: TonB-dependent receptor plug domain-containing protein [Gemmatimonadota bacterium]|nr:MAG: TonB-dependent receptor plug domain-containing protein [Gemmatimonadota bacterium]